MATPTGIELDRASGLTAELRRWAVVADDIASSVLDAQLLSGLVVDVVGHLDDLARDGRVLAHGIDDAVDTLLSYRLSLAHTVGQLHVPELAVQLVQSQDVVNYAITAADRAEAQAIVYRIRAATSDGRAPNAGDYERLDEIFHNAIADVGIAQTAVVLSLRGYPVDQTLLLQSDEQLHQVFDHIADVMVNGQSPASAGLSAGLFPIAYQEWHRTSDQLDDGALSEFEAITALARSFEAHADRWLAASLGELLLSPLDLVTFSNVVGLIMRKPGLDTLTFAELGADGTAALVDALAGNGEDFLSTRWPLLSNALAQASHGELGFSGADLIRADIHGSAESQESSGASQLPAELLLLVDGFDPAFLLGAATASLEYRGDDYVSWSGWRGMPVDAPPDPRNLAMQAVVNNGLAAELIVALARVSALDLLLFPELPMQGANPMAQHLGATAEAPVAVLLAQAGAHPAAAHEIVNYFNVRGGYDEIPGHLDLPGLLAEHMREERQVVDPVVLTGLSAMLTIATQHYVSGPGQEHFLNAYDTVLVSGAGNEVEAGAIALFGSAISEQLAQGQQLELDDLLQLHSVIAAMRHQVHLDNAVLKDQASANVSSSLSVLGIVGGPVSPGGAFLASVAALMPTSQHALTVATDKIDDLLTRDALLYAEGVTALLDSEQVTTKSGDPVRVETRHDVPSLINLGTGEVLGELSTEALAGSMGPQFAGMQLAGDAEAFATALHVISTASMVLDSLEGASVNGNRSQTSGSRPDVPRDSEDDEPATTGEEQD